MQSCNSVCGTNACRSSNADNSLAVCNCHSSCIVVDALQEVTNLVESPTVILGSFDSGFLSLPR